MVDKPVLLVDFNNAAWRSAHALKGAAMTYGGNATEVVYGILAEVGRAMERFSTNRVILCGDHPKGPARRVAIYPEYKQREKREDEEKLKFRETVARGMRLTRKMLRAAGYQGYAHAAGYEADDLIAAFHYAYDGQQKVIVSTDQDLYQLLDGDTVIHRPGNKDGPMTLQTFHRKYGIVPALWVGVKALAGCTSDNVPGCRGVGETTAIRYLKGELVHGKKLEAVEAHLRTAAYKRDRRLVRIPFDDGLYDPACKQGDDFALLNEIMWNSVCEQAGVLTLPYPGGV